MFLKHSMLNENQAQVLILYLLYGASPLELLELPSKFSNTLLKFFCCIWENSDLFGCNSKLARAYALHKTHSQKTVNI